MLRLFAPGAQAVALVNVLATMILPKPNGEGDVTVELMSDMQADNLKDSLDQDIRPVYEEALTRQKVSVHVLQVILLMESAPMGTPLDVAPQRSMAGQAPPVWAILLVIILGFNEFVATVQFVASPANLLMVIMGATLLCAAYVLHSLNLLGMCLMTCHYAMCSLAERGGCCLPAQGRWRRY